MTRDFSEGLCLSILPASSAFERKLFSVIRNTSFVVRLLFFCCYTIQ